ncbi:MAG: acetyltransferase [Clostridia bacterium]|nr:acetyltransferase [Clostridia bacterium]
MNCNILLLGCGGHFRSVLDSIKSTGKYNKIGLVDNSIVEKSYFGIEVVGTDDDLGSLKSEYDNAFITVGSVGDISVREKLFGILKKNGYNIPNIIDATAVVSGSAFLGCGVYVGKKAVINAGSVIGDCSIINSGAIIEHDCALAEFVHASPGAILCGDVKIGYGTHIGAGAAVKQGVTVGRNCIVGLASAVLSDIEEDSVAYGNPCRIIRKR